MHHRKHHLPALGSIDEDTSTQKLPVAELMQISFPMCDAVELMDSGVPYEIVSDQATCSQGCNTIPITENPDFYFNIVTIVNFIAAVTSGFIVTCCYTKRQHLLTMVANSVLQTMEHAKQAKALKLTEDEPIDTTEVPTTPSVVLEYMNNKFTTPWIFLIVLLSLLTLFACYWIIVLILIPMTRKSSVCRFLFPCRTWNNDFLTPATDILLDIVHIQSGE